MMPLELVELTAAKFRKLLARSDIVDNLEAGGTEGSTNVLLEASMAAATPVAEVIGIVILPLEMIALIPMNVFLKIRLVRLVPQLENRFRTQVILLDLITKGDEFPVEFL